MALISSIDGLPPACTMCIDFSFFFLFVWENIFFSFSFSLTRYLFIHPILLILLVMAIITKWLTLRATRMSNFEELTTMIKWDDGRKTRGKACESGCYPCDSRRKFSTVGHLGKVMREWSRNLPRDARRLKISVCQCYHWHWHMAFKFARLSSHIFFCHILVLLYIVVHTTNAIVIMLSLVQTFKRRCRY